MLQPGPIPAFQSEEEYVILKEKEVLSVERGGLNVGDLTFAPLTEIRAFLIGIG
jgi:hypothetical protein